MADPAPAPSALLAAYLSHRDDLRALLRPPPAGAAAPAPAAGPALCLDLGAAVRAAPVRPGWVGIAGGAGVARAHHPRPAPDYGPAQQEARPVGPRPGEGPSDVLPPLDPAYFTPEPPALLASIIAGQQEGLTPRQWRRAVLSGMHRRGGEHAPVWWDAP